MTKREYLDLLIDAAHDGTFPSVAGSVCRYRTESGRRCAVGVLISEEQYAAWFEARRMACEGVAVDQFHPEVLQAILPDDMSVLDLKRIQEAHDGVAREGPWHAGTFLMRLKWLHIFDDCDWSRAESHDSAWGGLRREAACAY